MDAGELDRVVRKLTEAKAISEWHFRDAVEEVLDEIINETELGHEILSSMRPPDPGY